MRTRKMFWLPKGIVFKNYTKQVDIDYRTRMVKQAIAGELGFCYKQVKRIPLASGRRIRTELEILKRERNTCESNVRAKNATFLIMQLREQEKEHWQFDAEAYKQLYSNYQKLHAALIWLQHEGFVNHFTIQGSGRLEVEWFTEWQGLHVQVIEQGWTYSVQRGEEQPEVLDSHCMHDILKALHVRKEYVTVSYGDRVPCITVQEILDRHYDDTKSGLVYGTMTAKKAESHANQGELDSKIVTRHLDQTEMLKLQVGTPPEQRRVKTELERKYPTVPLELIRPSRRRIVR